MVYYIYRYRCIDIDKAVPLKVYFTNLYPQLWIHIVEVYRIKATTENEKQNLYLKNISTFVFYRFSQIDIFQLYYTHVTSLGFEHSKS